MTNVLSLTVKRTTTEKLLVHILGSCIASAPVVCTDRAEVKRKGVPEAEWGNLDE